MPSSHKSGYISQLLPAEKHGATSDVQDILQDLYSRKWQVQYQMFLTDGNILQQKWITTLITRMCKTKIHTTQNCFGQNKSI